MPNIPDVNPSEFDYRRLLDPAVMASFTLDRQRAHYTDTAVYERALATIEAALRAQAVPGDSRFSARRRARRAVAPLRAAVKHSRALEAALEKARTRMADHQQHIEALPAQREAKELRRAARRGQVAELTAKSLHKSAAVRADEGAAEVPADTSKPTARGINDLFNQRRGA